MRSRLSKLLLSDSHVTLKSFSEISESSSEAGEMIFFLSPQYDGSHLSRLNKNFINGTGAAGRDRGGSEFFELNP